MAPPPPWIILLFLLGPAVTANVTTIVAEQTTEAEAENENVTLTRTSRGTSDHAGTITQNPTYYLARSYTNEAGERRNVLIPVQATAASEPDRSAGPGTSDTPTPVPTYHSAISPTPDNYSPTQIYALTQDMLMTLHKAGLIANPLPQTTIPPTQPSSAGYTIDAGNTVLSVSVPQATVYPSPEALRLTADDIKSNAYHAAKQKTAAKPHRNRIRVRPNKNKYTSTKLQFSLPTSPSPFTNKVRFELEDARVPSSSSIALQPVTASLPSTSQTYTSTAISTSLTGASTGLSRYLEPDNPKQFYIAQEGAQVEYMPVQKGTFSALPSKLDATALPQVSNAHFIESNSITGTQHQSPTPSLPVGPPAPQAQLTSNHLAENDDRNPAPHVEYVKITDIDVAPQPTPTLRKQPLHNFPHNLPHNLPKQHYQYLKYGGHAFQGGASHAIQYFPQLPSRVPSHHQQYILQAQKVRVNPRPQITFASDSGLRSAVKTHPPAPQRGLSPVKSTTEPAIELIQSNEVTFAPEIMQFDAPQQTRPREPPVQTHAQYVQEIGPPATVTSAPKAQYQQTTANPNDPTPSIELEYTPGKLPPMVEEAYNILKQTDQLPQKITPDNIDGSIKTLGLILKKLQQYQSDPSLYKANAQIQKQKEQYRAQPEFQSNEQDYSHSQGSTPGRPGVDYPTYHKIPKTSFDCNAQRYKGFFGDPDTRCQVWHYCDLNGGQASFLCPNGTIFSQVALTCDWWFNVKCATTSQLYVLNERLYKYILPFAPSFPEDYSGPGVDRYLTAKFEEQETKNNKVRSVLNDLTTTSSTTPSTSLQPTTTAASVNLTT